MPTPMIRLANVTQYYGARPILRDLSLDVQAGELLAVMGPNGTGKSTLLQVAAGLLWPLEGYVEVAGLRRRSTAANELAIRQQVVYLPADAWLPGRSVVKEFLVAVGRVYGVDDRRLLAHADQLLTVFNLTEQAYTEIARLSTGQKKKVALCSAFIVETPILILDEPFSGGLDPSGIIALRKVLTHMAQRDDITALIATPVPELVEQFAEKVAVMHDGAITAVDTPAAIKARFGGDVSLEEALERVLEPQTLQHVDEYLETWKR
ncbi:MAG: ABC transporter ATP-binding protein [Phycisphaerales bacterium]|nr:ABC transporter ATP-binding protein [Phycisphaerales bacterium]